MDIKLEHLHLLPEILDELKHIKENILENREKRWLSTKEVATYLGYSKDRIYKLKDETFIEGFHFYKREGKILFDRVAIDLYVVGKDKSDDTIQSQRQAVDRLLSSIQTVS